MGVQGLWPLLDPARNELAFSELAVQNIDSPMRVAIDISVWIHSATSSLINHNAGDPDHIRLRSLLSRCLRIISAGFLPVFVFDYSSIDPAFSHNAVSASTETIVASSALVQNNSLKYELARLLCLLKVPWFVASPHATAEAECASLNLHGLVDAVMSDDGDSFLFGAKMVIRNWSGSTKVNSDRHEASVDRKRKRISTNNASSSSSTPIVGGLATSHDLEAPKTPERKGKATKGVGAGLGKDHVAVYTMDRIFDHTECGWNRNALILIALLSGADDAPGVPGVGINTASELAKSGLADQIIPAAVSNSTHDLHSHLSTLLTQLKTNSFGLLSQKRPSAVKNLDSLLSMLVETWPDIARGYATPAITKSQDIKSILEGYMNGWWRDEYRPDVSALAAWYHRNSNWSKEVATQKMCNVVLPYLRVRELYILGRSNSDASSAGQASGAPFAKLVDFFPVMKPVSSGVGGTAAPAAKGASLSRTVTPVRGLEAVDEGIIEKIVLEKTEFGVDLVRVVWSDRGMNLNVPEGLAGAGGNLLLQAEEDDDDIVFNDADEDRNDDEPMLATSNSLFRDKHQRTWVEKALIQRAYPQVLDAWRLTKSNKAAGRRSNKNQTTPQSISKNQPSVASFFLKPSPAHAPNFPTVQSTITPQTASTTKPKYFVNLCSDDDDVSPGASSSTTMLNPANGFDSDEDETPSERRKRLKSESDASNGTKPPPAPRKKTAFYKNMEEIARKPFPTSPKGKSRNLF